MSKHEKTKENVLGGNSDNNIRFDELRNLLLRLNFIERIRATSHHVFRRDGVIEIINIQEGKDGKAKPYQVKQIRDVINRYQL